MENSFAFLLHCFLVSTLVHLNSFLSLCSLICKMRRIYLPSTISWTQNLVAYVTKGTHVSVQSEDARTWHTQQFVATISFGKIILQEYCVLAGFYFELPFFRLFEFGVDISHGLIFYYTLLAEEGWNPERGEGKTRWESTRLVTF